MDGPARPWETSQLGQVGGQNPIQGHSLYVHAQPPADRGTVFHTHVGREEVVARAAAQVDAEVPSG